MFAKEELGSTEQEYFFWIAREILTCYIGDQGRILALPGTGNILVASLNYTHPEGWRTRNRPNSKKFPREDLATMLEPFTDSMTLIVLVDQLEQACNRVLEEYFAHFEDFKLDRSDRARANAWLYTHRGVLDMGHEQARAKAYL